MERDANYVAVGAFILIAVSMAVLFVLWYADASDRREFKLYEIYFAGSVSGLDRGSPVRYLGVDVGRVRRLAIDSDDPSRVLVVAEIDSQAPISSATRANLGIQGVTGLLYVNLKEQAGVDKTEPLQQGKQYPVIESVASEFDVFLASLPELMGRATSILERLGQVLSDDNLKHLSETLGNVRAATAMLPQTSQNVAELVAELRTTVHEISGTAQSLRTMTDEIRPGMRETMARLSEIADSLARVAERVDGFTRKSEVQLGHFAEQGLFELERLVREARSAAREFRDLSRNLQENPSQIIYEPQESGVAIPP